MEHTSINNHIPVFSQRFQYGQQKGYGGGCQSIRNVPVVIKSSSGVRQGDPLGPLFFCLAIRLWLEKLVDHLGPNHCILAYLDDIHIPSANVGALATVKTLMSLTSSPLTLNKRKCWERSVSDIRNNGAIVLGAAIGNRVMRADYLAGRIQEEKQKISRQPDLPHQ